MNAEPAEGALRAAVLAGDEQAWRALYDAHADRLYAYVRYRVGGHAADAEEVAQECWTVAVRRIRAFDPDRGTFAQWLYGIAQHLLANRRRKQSRQAAVAEQCEAPVTEAADHALARREQITAAYSMLPQRHREVLKAKYEEQRPVAEIARARGESEKAVESLLTRARAAFREAFDALEREAAQELDHGRAGFHRPVAE